MREAKQSITPPYTRGRGSESSCGLFGLFAIGMYPPGYADSDDIERKHGDRVDAHRPRIGAGADDRRNQKDSQNGVADVLPEEFRAYDPEHCQKEDEDRQLEADAQAEDDGEKETAVILDGDHRRETVPESEDEDVDCAGQHVEVAEGS